MKIRLFVLLFLASTKLLFGQTVPKEYTEKVKTAESLYQAKDFKNSASNYSEAFKSNGWKASVNDRYNAACSWAMASGPDSAFSQLERIAVKFSNYNHITTDTDLSSLHNDKRWKPLIGKIKQNQEKAEANLNKPLVAKLGTIYNEDQKYRQQIADIEKKYGGNSKEMNDHWQLINKKDSLNLIEVKAILDKYGWLGPDVVGGQGSVTLFLVIQHADQATQEKYLPMMRDAVKNGKAQSSSLALLEDRVALRQGKRQIYGSQIGRDPETQIYYVSPLEDPENVDKRRADVGLPPLAEYVKNWQMKWDAEQYKKDLPELEAKIKHK
ncbi:hypothetical protein FW781_12580 [Chryseobacterium panacisoli]|uniref:Tetratricopeptide repeat protein n=1 Tax=Chryseobacterium panacisoli TaxID=1807141 RepID=A0A5D8ZMS6_9FLAO|nr:DUF6624 domain-containing protein [Chryseobacterium panacisoli]TZF96258.1 hypothetical protein FW781_12580 [Chryseobacterium panacisoli]